MRGAEPGSQARPRPGGFEAPHLSSQTGGLSQPARARERERKSEREGPLSASPSTIVVAVWELGELTLCIDEWMNRRGGLKH